MHEKNFSLEFRVLLPERRDMKVSSDEHLATSTRELQNALRLTVGF
jgi:hypothetical protein